MDGGKSVFEAVGSLAAAPEAFEDVALDAASKLLALERERRSLVREIEGLRERESALEGRLAP